MILVLHKLSTHLLQLWNACLFSKAFVEVGCFKCFSQLDVCLMHLTHVIMYILTAHVSNWLARLRGYGAWCPRTVKYSVSVKKTL